MSLLEENLPGVGRVKKDFQLREDHVIAKQLQEKEYEDHFDANVQARRTAMKDAQMAKSFQATETNAYRQEESIRRDRLREQEERDREAAERYAREIQLQEEERQRQDEEAVQRLHREEMERERQRKRQEEEDSRIALQHVRENESLTKRRQQEAALGEQEARRLQQMEAKPVGLGLPSYESLGFSLPPPPPAPPTEEEEFVDEAARQEDEDARIARELLEREEREAQKRRRQQELADIEMARKLQEMESKGGRPKPTGHPTDADIARRMELEAREKQRKLESQVQADAEMAQKVKSELYRQHSEQEMNDWELAKRLQKAEIVAHKKATQVRGGGGGGGPVGASFSHPSRPVAASSPTQSLPATMPTNGQYRGQGNDRVMVRPAESASSRLQRQGTDPQLTGYYPVEGDGKSYPDSPQAVQAYKRQSSAAGKDVKKGKGKKK